MTNLRLNPSLIPQNYFQHFFGLYRYCPWIAHTNLLAKYHRATVQEERQVTNTPKFGSEAFHLWVERFCCCIRWAVDKIVGYFVLFWFEGFHGWRHLWQFACWYLLVPSMQFLLGSLLGQFLISEDSTQLAYQRVPTRCLIQATR